MYSVSTSEMPKPPELDPSPPRKYVRAVGPRLRKLLYFIFAIVALLGANSAYLSAITALEGFTGRTYQNYFYQYMFLGHLVLGLVLILPFIVFGMLHLAAARNRRNRRATRIGYALFAVSIGVLITGILLMRIARRLRRFLAATRWSVPNAMNGRISTRPSAKCARNMYW